MSLPKYAVLIEDDALICRWKMSKVYGTIENMGCSVIVTLL
jgi:hypothetical protein